MPRRSLPRFGLRAHAKVWLERDGRVALSDWRVRLLQAIDETGSLSAAAARLEVPYRTAWYKLKEIESELGVRLLETRSGGRDGGCSTLTPRARSIVERFERVVAGIDQTVARRLREELPELLAGRTEVRPSGTKGRSGTKGYSATKGRSGTKGRPGIGGRE